MLQKIVTPKIVIVYDTFQKMKFQDWTLNPQS